MTFKYKLDTDLYELNKKKTFCLSLTISNDGKYFALYSRDKHFRIFKFRTGRIFKVYNESLKFYIDNYQDVLKNEMTKLDKHDYDKRLLNEKEIEKIIDYIQTPNIQFDETSKYIYYPSIVGIKLIEIQSNKVIKILGKKESSERFLHLNLFQGKPLRVKFFLMCFRITQGSSALEVLAVKVIK